MVDKSTKAICPFFCKSGDMRIKCEGFCEEVVKLTLYIRKDVTGTKRLKTSRNLIKPIVTVTEGKKREFKKLEKGEALQIPQGYYLVRDEMWVNDFTGANYHFVFMQLTATRRLTNNEPKTNQRNE
jgi:hypothetical protein|nr:MAG TPA: hypothetical protein [Caudoviricetes sp.]